MFTQRFSVAVFVAAIVLVSRIALAAGPVSEPPPVLPNDTSAPQVLSSTARSS